LRELTTMNRGASLRSRRLLVVDDKLEIHDDFAKILGPKPEADGLEGDEAALFGTTPSAPQAAFELDFADRGEMALELVRRSIAADLPYALAFVDVRMPTGWDGIRTVGELWTIDPRIQIVLCTAYSDYSWDDITTRLGVGTDFLILKKPFEVIEVRQIAHALTQKWGLLQEKERHLDQLELEVTRRTAELAEANARLQEEMASNARIEKERRHAQKLEALGRLAAGVGHEINNPLTFISGNLAFCREELDRLALARPDVSFAPMSDAIDDAACGAERIRRIVGEIKQFSRTSEAALGPVDVRASVRAAHRLVDSMVRHRASFIERFDALPNVIGEQSQLEQVLVNLLMNAAHALPIESAATNEIVVAARICDGEVILEVQDNGVGIAEENLERVFDPFFTTREVGEGSGLGLSISRGIVERFGGRIEIESQVGRGTVVRTRLRRAVTQPPPAPAPRAGAAEETAPEIPVGRLLLIDDEPLVLHVMQRMLRSFEVCAMTDGAEAVKRYQAGDFDLVLCDLMMPGFSGMDVHGALAKLGPEHVQRMVFVTGGAYTTEGAAFLATVTNPHLDKPFNSEQLRRLVESQIALLGTRARAAPRPPPSR
jgi:two-component system NtrC family sensor kinase